MARRNTIFAFLGSKSLDHSLQFENHQMGLIQNLYEKKIIEYRNVVMLVYVPAKSDSRTEKNIISKTAKMKAVAARNGFNLDLIFAKGKTPGSLWSAFKQLKERLSPFSKKIIFSQNYYCGYMGLRLKQSLTNVYLHTNFRGLPADEELVYSESFFLKRILVYLILKIMGRKIIPGSDSLSVVSQQYKRYLKRQNKSAPKVIVVYPCAYNAGQFHTDASLRHSYRQKHHIQNHQKVFIYSGSMHKYQMPSDIFRFFENVSNQDTDNKCVFIFLTFEKEKARHLAKSFLIPNLIISSESDQDLTGIYNAGDIGVICRKKDIVNRVASPTKIAEYLATGNSVILTEGIGDYADDLKDKKFAIIKEDIPSFVNTPLNELMDLNRLDKKDLAWVKSNYSNENIGVFKDIFESL